MQKSSKQLRKASASGLKEVKDTFTDVDDYLATFEPLLFEEVKAQIVQAKDEDEGTICFFLFNSFCLCLRLQI